MDTNIAYLIILYNNHIKSQINIRKLKFLQAVVYYKLNFELPERFEYCQTFAYLYGVEPIELHSIPDICNYWEVKPEVMDTIIQVSNLYSQCNIFTNFNRKLRELNINEEIMLGAF